MVMQCIASSVLGLSIAIAKALFVSFCFEFFVFKFYACFFSTMVFNFFKEHPNSQSNFKFQR